MAQSSKALPWGDVKAASEEAAGEPTAALLDEAAAALAQVVAAPNPPAALPDPLQGCAALRRLYADLLLLRAFLLALVKGDLSQELHLRGFLAGTLKALQANLRHLTWQTQMIAAGDFTQRVDFMGDFSAAFNAMVVQLDDNRRQLQEKQAALARLNEELRAEIERRKQTEAALRQSEASYRQLAISDPLTGAHNRRHFFQRAQEELYRAGRYQRPVALIIFDLDFFKQVNDTYGHAAGDRVLQTVAALVRGSIRAADIFARYGGEEFILLLPEAGLEAGLETAERLRRTIAAAPVSHPPDVIPITISAGVAALPAPGQPVPWPPETLDRLINQADQALYAAKNAGRNRVQAFPALPGKNSAA